MNCRLVLSEETLLFDDLCIFAPTEVNQPFTLFRRDVIPLFLKHHTHIININRFPSHNLLANNFPKVLDKI